ncbi:CaiB/BaiF CoA-transferase family protein [Ammoniphilus sp. YIM 78166]|uniref:CaiB/BaiF CoA transferase family protein n=1 Tax=Ammoniphilus sp. YIM 78166 TaxID=1644106 RepID=UPI00106FFF90|nr:CoA transferase [Ammoniphilus sp. YIM 78166]
MWPLEGIRVVDLTQNVAGPYAGMILADFGASVTKVEPPGGDATRSWGPPFWENASPTFLAMNRNKSQKYIDIKTQEGKKELDELLTEADVLLVSSRPGAMERLGLDYECLAEKYPRLIYGEVTAFGNHGPRRMEPGYDPLMQAMGGIMSVTGHEGQAPVRVGTSIIDMTTGMWLAIGVFGALHLRQQTGKGQRITSSLYETSIAWMSYHIPSYWGTGESPQRWGSGPAMIMPYEAFPTKDKWLVIAAGNDGLFQKLCSVLGHDEWITDPRFMNNAERVRNRNELRSLICEMTQKEDSAYWISKLGERGIPSAPVLNVEEMMKEPQLEASGIIQSISHPQIPDFKSVALPIRMNDERPPLRIPPPL